MTERERIAQLEMDLRDAREAIRTAASTAEAAIRRLQIAERVVHAMTKYWRSVDPKIVKDAEDAVRAWEQSRQ